MARVSVASFLLISITLVSLAGCGASNAPSDKAQLPSTSNAENSRQQTASESAVRETLVGVWVGVGFLDEARVEQVVSGLEPQRREQTIQQYQYFLATVMGMKLDADSRMTSEVEIGTGGTRPETLTSSGTWQVSEVDGQTVTLILHEQQSDGSTSTTRRQCEIYPDGNHLAIKVSLDGALGSCDPMFLFERQGAKSEVASQPETSTVK